MKGIILILIVVTSARSDIKKQEQLVLPSLFSDNMVLQQKSLVPIWGKGMPGQRVIVKASWGESARAIVGADGNWKVYIRTVDAGGPHLLQIKSADTTIVYRNVMLGEVWLCSGQSNMEMPLQGWLPDNPISNSTNEIQAANYPEIRLFTVGRAVATEPQFDCVGRWEVCTSQTAARFSAVGYFFGRDLYRELRVPIGLILSSWGGTKIQSWISGRYLEELPEYKSTVEKMDSLKRQLEVLEKWIYSHTVIDLSAREVSHQFDNLNFNDSMCSESNFDDSAWASMNLPTYWEATTMGEFDGAVWFRKRVQIPGNWIDSTLVLELGPIDDMDETWVNGVKVGGLLGGGYWNTPRVYEVQKGTVSDSNLTIAVRVIDIGGGGGMWGGGVKMRIHPKSDTMHAISLTGQWKYLPVAEYTNSKFYVYGVVGEPFYHRPKLSFPLGPNTPTVLFNGMIAPVIPYRIKGVIWYQGESNAGTPNDYNSYRYLFALLIKNWRDYWHEGIFPFYWAQISPWSYPEGWKSYMIRDAQRRALSVPNTGMAVTLDISSLTSIHPPDKQDVGLRLALWALAKNYGKHITYSGPLYKSMKVEKGRVVITFKYVDGGLVLKPLHGETNFLIAGRDSNFVKAEVRVVRNKLVVYSSKVEHPVAVRYTWSNTDGATLFNKAGLPASTFRTDNWNQ